MHNGDFRYPHGEDELLGYLAHPTEMKGSRPAVMVIHDWSGRNDFACQKAQSLTELGYIGFAIDMFGQGKVGETTEEKQALIQPLVADRLLLLARVRSAYHALVALDTVDTQRIAVMGFCFGGLCALDLARSGAPIAGVVSFHGLLSKPEGLPSQAIKSKVLALHGYDDPMVSPAQVNIFCEEMTQAKADWQVHMYGHTKHAFTNPHAHDQQLGTIYNASTNQRAMQSMTAFLAELFA